MAHSLITVSDHIADLHKKAHSVTDPKAQNIKSLVEDMIAVMRTEKGVGLAAPQVAALCRIAVFDIGTDGRNVSTPLVCINPVITKATRDLVMTEEGCLSIPGTFIPVVRSEKVSVRYYDINGKRHTINATNLLAIALQHEIDHLDGILMTDRYDQQTALRTQFSTIQDDGTIAHRIG